MSYKLGIPVYTTPFTYKGGDEFTFVFCSDTHFGEDGHMDFLWKRLVDTYKGKPNTYLAHGGDHCPWITWADWRFNPVSYSDKSKENLHNIVTWWQQDLIERYTPLAPQLLWLQDGNHEEKLRRSTGNDPLTFPVQDLSLKGDREIIHMPMRAFVQLKFKHKGTGKSTHYIDLYVQHGFGGATVTPGGVINRFVRQNGWIEVDVVVFGHVHRLFHLGMPRWKRPTRHNKGKSEVYQDTVDFVCTGSMVDEAYSGCIGYASRAGYPPSEPGWYEMKVKLQTNKPAERQFLEVRA